MAAPTVTSLLTTITTADSLTGWNTGSLDTDGPIQGTGCVGGKVSTATTTFHFDSAATRNFSAAGANNSDHIYIWANCSTPSLDTMANGGMGIYVGNGTSTGVWYVAGSDTYPGGWRCFVIDPSRPFDIVSGSWTTNGNPTQLTNVRYYGFRFKTIGAIMGNFNNCLVDAIRIGRGIRITDGDLAQPATFAAIRAVDDLQANKFGIIREESGAYFIQGTVEVGHAAGSSSTYFKDSDAIIIFEDKPISSTLYGIVVQNNTSFILGDASGSGMATVTSSPVSINGAKSALYPTRFRFNATDPNIAALELYGTTFSRGSSINIGPIAASAIRLVDCSFENTGIVSRTLQGTGAPLQIRNKISNNTGGSTSLILGDTVQVDGGEWQLINTRGISSTGAGSVYTVANMNFMNVIGRYLTIDAGKQWRIVNPTWNPITADQTNLYFSSTSGTDVQEKYELAINTQEASGIPIINSRTYVYQGLSGSSLPLDNQISTDEFGFGVSEVLTRRFTPNNIGGTMAIDEYGAFALKVYKYGFVPFVGSVTLNARREQFVTLLDDPAITNDSAAALDAGSAITVTRHGTSEVDGRSVVVMHYIDNTGVSPVAGDVVVGGSSGATGECIEYIGTSTEGHIVLKNRNEFEFINDEIITIGTSTFSATADISGRVQSFYQNYTWVIDGADNTLQVVYDYLAARLDESPITPAFEKVVLWGSGEHANMMFSGNVGYFTRRNVLRNEGVWIANTTGVISYLTSDAGVQFIPPQEYTFSITGLLMDSEVRLYNAATDEMIAGTESSGTSFTHSYIYVNDVEIYVVVFHLIRKVIRLTDLILSNASQTIPVQQQLDRVYQGDYVAPSPTPTVTPTNTPTPTATVTPTVTPTPTATPTVTPTPSAIAEPYVSTTQVGLLGPASLPILINANHDDHDTPTPPPFPWKLFGVDYGSGGANGGLFTASNSFVTMGYRAPNVYQNFTAASPGRGFRLRTMDSSYQRLYAGTENGGDTYRIRFEGTAATSGTVGSPNIVWELTFFKNNKVQLVFGVASGATTHSAVSNGSAYVPTFTAVANTSYAMDCDANGNDWVITTGSIVLP